jgi:hypothetical protein
MATVLWSRVAWSVGARRSSSWATVRCRRQSFRQGFDGLDAVAAAVFGLVRVPGFHEVGDDAVRRALGDADDPSHGLHDPALHEGPAFNANVWAAGFAGSLGRALSRPKLVGDRGTKGAERDECLGSARYLLAGWPHSHG